jgi:hypothetical protein
LFHPNYKISLNERIKTDNSLSYKNVDVSPTESIFVKRDGNDLVTKDGYFLSSFTKSKVVISPEKINSDILPNTSKNVEKSTKSTTKATNASLEEDLNNSPLGKTARKIQIGFTVVGWGVFGILAYKFWNKSTTWKVLLSVFGAYNLYSTYKVFSKPALQVGDGSDSNTGTKTNTSNTNLTKAQKIDLIVSTLSDPEQKGMDAFNRKFISTLSDAELNTWIKLSKAIKDKSIQAEDKQQVYKILQTKYNVSQKEFDDSMKKYGEALMNEFEKGFQEGLTNATEQVFEEGFTNQQQSMFSNFESSLDLDL